MESKLDEPKPRLPIMADLQQKAASLEAEVRERKRVEQELRAKEAQLRLITNHAPVNLAHCDTEGRYLFVNEPYAARFGLRASEVIGKRIQDVLGEAAYGAIQPYIERVLRGESVEYELEIPYDKIGPRWMFVRYVPDFDEQNQIRGLVAAISDITALKKAEQQLRQQTEQLSAFLETAALGLHRVGADGRILWANKAELEMLGYAAEEYIGHHISEFHADPPVIDDILERLCRSERLREYEARLKCKDGSIKHVLIDSSVLRDQGRFVHTQCFTRDITERKRAEQQLQESEQRLSRLIGLMPAAVYACDAEGKITFYNRRAAELWGREPSLNSDAEKFCAAYKCWSNGNFVPPAETPMAIAVREGRSFRDIEPVFERPDGTKVTVLVNIDPILDANGKPCGAINVFQDITRLKQVEESFRTSEERLRAVFDSTAVGVAVLSPSARFLQVNDAFCSITGYSKEELLSLDCSGLTHPEDVGCTEAAIDELMKGTASRFVIEKRYIRKDGSVIWVQNSVSITHDSSGQPEHLVALCQDITRRRNAEEALRRSEERLRLVTDNVPAMISYIDRDLRYQFVNGAYFEWFGCKPEEIHGRPMWEILGPEIFRQRQPYAEAALRGEIVRFEGTTHHRDLGLRHTEVVYLPDRSQAGEVPGFYGFIHDITDRNATEQRLRNSEARFRGLVNSVEGIVWECAIEPDGFRFTFVSQEAERLLGYPVEQWLKQRDFWANHLHPEDRDWAVAFCLSATQRKQDHEFEYRMIAADGRIVWLRDLVTVAVEGDQPARLVGVMVDVTERKNVEEALRKSEALFRELADSMPQIVWAARPDGFIDYYNKRWYEYTGLPEAYGHDSFHPIVHPEDLQRAVESYHTCIQSEEPFQIEVRFKDRQTGGYRWFLGRALPIRDETGRIIRWFGTCTDIDDHKRAAEKLEQAVAHRTAALQEAVAQMEEFSYSVSHDLRGPLRAMQGYCHILLEEAASQLTPDNLSYLKRVATSAERLDRLVQDVLAYTRVSRMEMQLKPVDLDHLVSDVLRTYTGEHRPLPEIQVARPLLNVLGHEPSLVQCLSNLIGNALKFVPPGQTPRVFIRTEPLDQDVRLWIEDNGIGIDPDHVQKIFMMFERSPEAADYPGTGVGLAIVKKAILRMHGDIGVESEPGKGSRFWIRLPSAR